MDKKVSSHDNYTPPGNTDSYYFTPLHVLVCIVAVIASTVAVVANLLPLLN